MYAGWLERYRRAWVEKDAAAARELFTPDAIYREQPFEPPFIGNEAVAGYWDRVTLNQRDIELRYGRPVAEGDRVAVEWWATLVNDDKPYTLAGEFLLRFADDGRCRELREYWSVKEGTHEPPAGWGT
jgi:ketosteroid isomerase-like protein